MHAEITEAMQTYFDGIYHSDVARLSRVFHPRAHYVCATEAALVYKTREEYFDVVAKREAPASRNEARRDAIVSIDLAGENTAAVKAHCAIGPKYFTDYLTFIRDRGEWRIISKVFHYDLVG